VGPLYGTITAYVPGAVAGSYHFTSAIAVQLLKSIEPLLSSPPTGACAGSDHHGLARSDATDESRRDRRLNRNGRAQPASGSHPYMRSTSTRRWAISSWVDTFFDRFSISLTTVSTTRSMLRFRSIGFMRTAVDLAPSRTIV